MPKFMRDFHDQKDLFKTINWWAKQDEKDCYYVNWTNAQVYVIDYFLRFMALHGYTLQKSKQKINFCDLRQSIEERTNEETELFKKYLEKSKVS